LKKYGFKCYFCGFSNAFGYSYKNAMSFYLSGAGGSAPNTPNPIHGFVKANLFNGKLYVRYYFKHYQNEWETWDCPVLDFEKCED